METPTFETANDKFKRGFGDWFWYSVAVATVVHMLAFAFFPEMDTADVSVSTTEFEAVDIPESIEIPPPPQQIARPATPVISNTVIDTDVTIAPTTFDANPVDNLPPPPTSSSGAKDIAAAPVYTPMTVRPSLRNQPEVERTLVRNYPTLLRDAGIGGTPTVWFFIDTDGQVLDTRLKEKSGYPALDDAALAVAKVMRFNPAMNGSKKVQVWVEIPIQFKAN